MRSDHIHPSPSTKPRQPLSRALRGAIVMVALIGVFFLLREHGSHIAGYWAYLLLLACPLMHLFHGHGGHGRHGDHHAPGSDAGRR